MSHFPAQRSAKDRFRELADEWKADCFYISSITDMVLHPAYQRIIGLGPEAIPYLLEELEDDADHWFWALKAITGEDPIHEEDRGVFEKMRAAWVAWGRERGYV